MNKENLLSFLLLVTVRSLALMHFMVQCSYCNQFHKINGGKIMAKDASFDIVSETNLEEVKNAIQMVKKEIDTRFDFKGTISEVKLEKEQLIIVSESEFKLEQVKDILTNKLVKRDISSKNLHFEKIEKAFGGNVRQTADLVNGIDKENAKKITQLIKQAEIKVKTQIQDDQIRVTGKSRDDLQKVMSLLREASLPIGLQFTNYR